MQPKHWRPDSETDTSAQGGVDLGGETARRKKRHELVAKHQGLQRRVDELSARGSEAEDDQSDWESSASERPVRRARRQARPQRGRREPEPERGSQAGGGESFLGQLRRERMNAGRMPRLPGRKQKPTQARGRQAKEDRSPPPVIKRGDKWKQRGGEWVLEGADGRQRRDGDSARSRAAKHEPADVSDVVSELYVFLHEARLEHFVEPLEQIFGLASVAELEVLEDRDLDEIGMKKIEKARLHRRLRSRAGA